MNGMQATDTPGNPGFAAWVRAKRKSLWLSQKKLARLVGCALVTIQKIEEGHRRPSPAVAEALARHLEITEEQLQQFLHLARTTPITTRVPTSTSPPRDRLPMPLQPLIGREDLLTGVQQHLLSPSVQMITLTGPPGVGKTRLAVQVAAELRGEFGGNLYFVPLASLDDHEQVLPTINRRLGLPDSGAATPAERLIRFLGGRQQLLVLDNFEHVLGAALPLAGVLEACPGLRLLITSRTALRLSGEQEWPLKPLEHGPAAQLFAERVRAFDPAFVLSTQTLPAVTEIVSRLDGLPLAIELAAMRLRYGPPEALVIRLRTTLLGSLGSGPVDGPARQHTLQAAIAWSYQRLDPRLQRVFRQLGIFVGGWSVEAAEAIAGAAPSDLESLLDGHLIQQGGQRLGILETLRAYALEQLDTRHEAAAARDAHQAYYLAAAQTHQDTDLDWFEAEVGNLRTALRAQLDGRQVEAALNLALAIYWFWETRGYQHEGLKWFSLILKQSARVAPPLRLAGLNTAATLAWQSGRFDLSRSWLAEATALSRETGDSEWEARVLMNQGKVEVDQGCYAQARRVLEPALRLARDLSSPWLVCAVLLQMTTVSLCLGEQDQTQILADEGLALCHDHPGLFWEAPLLEVLGLVALERGQASLARRHLIQALRLMGKFDHRLMQSLILTTFAATLAGPDADQDDLRQAVGLWACAEATRNCSGYGWSVAIGERFERWTSQSRQRLGDPDWILAWAAGRTMPLQDAVADLLAEATERLSPPI
ncbi:helix-turn-helix domain-containing protein [Deinococcus detaillensis]|uniref:Helix-turn-helix domain-containing protein n=1 Tax=Deinococcus detaillensis TaxID=2592048 RepID=A0A553UNB8_9DEIO|nr:NB-ARC domain-containing protein [Deinococcus detaillensis]TSA81714.1 helix-turn-helix domain-containing protein [Deinococcus detaillensis]